MGVWTLGGIVTAATLAASGLAAAQALRPPLPPMHAITDNFWGAVVRDPYRYFENREDPEAQPWQEAQAAHAATVLAAIPGRAALQAAIAERDAARPLLARVTRLPGELYFIERRGAADDAFKLFVRRGLNGRERLLVDPDALARKTGVPHAINGWVPSPDGRLLAYGLSTGGAEQAVLHLLDVASGRALGRPIERANSATLSWAADGRRFVVNRLPPFERGMSDAERFQHSQVLLLTVGLPESRAQPVFGSAFAALGITAAETPTVRLSPDGRWAIGSVARGAQRERGVFVAPQAGVLAGRPAWRRVAGAADAVTALSVFGDTLYLVSHRGAPRSQLLALDLARPGPVDLNAAAVVLLPASRNGVFSAGGNVVANVVVNIGAAADALYIEVRHGNLKRLFKRAHGPAEPVLEVPLPVQGAFQLADDDGGMATDPRVPGALFALQGWTVARRFVAVAADGSVGDSGLQPAGRFDAPADIVATDVELPSHDGVRVPLTIIHKAGLALDASHPTLLTAYAAYGMTEEPEFRADRLAWLDAGGVWAVANPRGSGIYGEDWARAGFQASKPNGWKDFIACAEYLVARRYTRPARLGIAGASAGGVVVGRALTERPELFGAVVIAAGVLDTLRMEATPNGTFNLPEFGSTRSEAGFKALFEMSPYAHVKPGTAYPAVLLAHGLNDPRVEVWQSAKMAARLQAATTSGRPVLLRLYRDAGHGAGNTRQQDLTERTDLYAFLLWQLGGLRPGAPQTP